MLRGPVPRAPGRVLGAMEGPKEVAIGQRIFGEG
jgi:hypothetical protein